jgi:hypothetical protein
LSYQVGGNQAIDEAYLKANYLQYPYAQGAENFVEINNVGQLNQGGRAEFSSNTIPANFLLPPNITDPIVYPATTPATAVATIGYVTEAVGGGGGGGASLTANQTFTGINTFSATPVFNAGITLDETINFFGGTYGNSITANSSGVLSITNNTPASTTSLSTNGLAITNSTNTTAINLNSNNSLNLYTNSSQGSLAVSNLLNNFTMVPVDTNTCLFLNPVSINVGDFNVLDGNISAKSGSLTTAQTYGTGVPTTTTTIATQGFVQQAINAGGGGGNVSTGTDNAFTAENSFALFPTYSTLPNTQNYPQNSQVNQFATIQYVNSIANPLITNTYTTPSVNTSNNTGSFVSQITANVMYYQFTWGFTFTGDDFGINEDFSTTLTSGSQYNQSVAFPITTYSVYNETTQQLLSSMNVSVQLYVPNSGTCLLIATTGLNPPLAANIHQDDVLYITGNGYVSYA